MSEKSHVGMGFHICPVTGEQHSESILLNTNLKETLEDRNFAGYHYSPEVSSKISEGYVCLVEVGNTTEDGKSLTLAEAERTGRYAFIKKELAEGIFGEDKKIEEVQYVSNEIIDFLEQIKLKNESESAGEESEV